MAGHVDELLDTLELETASLEELRAALQPAMTRLIAALGQFFVAQGNVQGRERATRRRDEYIAQRNSLRPVIERWEASRGSADALWTTLAAMTPEQTRRFDALATIERAGAAEREEFLRLWARTRSLLLLFEEVAV